MAFAVRLEVAGVGPQRAGTTWLHACLLDHPQLCFPREVKETFFFDERFHKGWSWYWSHFRHRTDGQLCAEIGPSYFDVPEAARRLREHNPNCRIIINLRDPAARSFSLYLHHRMKGRLTCDFQEANRRMPRIIEASRYRTHLTRWIELFGLERILIVLQDDISSCPERVLKRVYHFVGIADMPAPFVARERVYAASLPYSPFLARLATSAARWLRDKDLYGAIEFAKRLGLERVYAGFQGPLPTLEPDTRRQLIEKFEPDIAYVEELLGRPLPEWRRLP